MITKTLHPKDTHLVIEIPRDLVGKDLRVSIEEAQSAGNGARSMDELKRFCDEFRFDVRAAAINRDDLHER